MNDNREIIERIREKIDIVSLVEKYVKLRKAGKNYQGLCPFHQEKTGSFIVSPDINRYKCFGCGKSGDIFTFIEEIETLTFPEALERLAKEAGVEIPKYNRNPQGNPLEEINEIGAKFFAKQLKERANERAYLYITGRGITDAAIEKFQIGYAPGHNSLLRYIQASKKFNKQQLVESGLFTEKNGTLKDRFINRIIFPIRTSTGRVVAFSGRQLPGDEFGPKYLNTPETAIFHKREILFGLYEAKNSMRKNQMCILSEGPLDVISAHSIGIDNVVAPQGTGLTEQQISLISRYCTNILFFFDADPAGQKAVERGFKLASMQGINSFATTPKPYKDLDEAAQNDPHFAQKAARSTYDAFTYLIECKTFNKDLSNLKVHEEVKKYIKELLADVSDRELRSLYITKANEVTRLQFDELQLPNRPTQDRTALPTDQPTAEQRDPNFQRELFFLSLLIESGLASQARKIDIKYLHSDKIKEILTLIIKLNNTSIEKLISSETLSRDAKKLLEEMAFRSNSISENSLADRGYVLNDIYVNIQINHYQSMLDSLMRSLAIAQRKREITRADKIISQSDKVRKQIEKLKKWKTKKTHSQK